MRSAYAIQNARDQASAGSEPSLAGIAATRRLRRLVARSSRDFPERAQRRSARTDEDDIAVLLVPSSAPGLRVGLHKHPDLSRPVCTVELAGVSVDSEAMLAGGADLYRVYWEWGP